MLCAVDYIFNLLCAFNCLQPMRKFVFSVASRATGRLHIKPSGSGYENSRNFVYNGQHFGDFSSASLRFCRKLRMKNIFYQSALTSQRQSLSWYLFVRLLHLSLKLCLSKMSLNETPSWLRSQNSEQPRTFRVTGANKNARKVLFTDLVNTKWCYVSVIWIHSGGSRGGRRRRGKGRRRRPGTPPYC